MMQLTSPGAPRRQRLAGLGIMVLCLATSLPLKASTPSNEFRGRIATELKNSEPDWPAPHLPPEGAPNVLIWVIDDAGLAHIGAFGGVIETPTLDRLAASGLRYSNFHATPVCSASRAALLTGRNPHRVHVGSHSGGATGFPGYDSHIPESMGTVADILSDTGYLTYALGKWDHLPTEDTTAAGPFDYWPSGQGFDRFYGFLAADTDNFNPNLWSDHTPLNLPIDQKGYHLSADMADKAILWISERDPLPQRPPFFMYWATGAVHAPHHAPREWIDYYKGRFDMGWDQVRKEILANQKRLGIIPEQTQLSPRPEGMPAWEELSANQKKSYARAMEVFAAQLTHTDREFGRILDYLEKHGELENTLVVVVSDNGASAEGGLNGTFSEHMFFNGRHPGVADNLKHFDEWGGPGTYPHVPMGWAVAGNTPFRYYKQTAYEGGTRVPMIMSWPRGIDASGEVRHQYHFISDIVPTILAASGTEAPAAINGVPQASFDGIDMSYSFQQGGQPGKRQQQYYEKNGNRAMYADGWKAVNRHRTKTWELPPSATLHDGWELYNVEQDINEVNNVAAEYPEKLKTLVSMFAIAATANNVYPIAASPGALRTFMAARAKAYMQSKGGSYVYDTRVSRIPEALAPPLANASFRARAMVSLDTRNRLSASGPLFALGGRSGGMSLFIDRGRPAFLYRNVDNQLTEVVSTQSLPSGESSIELHFQQLGTNGAVARLTVNGEAIGEATVPPPLARMFSLHETFDVGSDSGSPVSYSYAKTPQFNGDITELRIDLIAP